MNVMIHQLVEGVVAGECGKTGKLDAQRATQSLAVTKCVHTKAFLAVFGRRTLDGLRYRSVTVKQMRLESRLQLTQGSHAANASVSLEIWRACSSSAMSSASGGMWSSRSIRHETGP